MPGKPSPKVRVAGYCRVSISMQVEGLSIGLQQSQIEQFCENKGWDLVHIYVDEGHSAKNFNRPDFKQLLEDMNRGRFSVIVITRVDRLVRSLRHLLRFIRDRLEPAGVRVVSIAEDIDTGDTSSKSRNVLILMGITAELERQVIRERVIPAVQAAAKSGRVGTHRRYGYRTDNKGNIRIDPQEKKVVQRIFQWAGDRNLSITAIANKVRNEGVPLSRDQVRHMLHNRFYLGELEYNRTMRGEDGKKRSRPNDEWIVIKKHHPALIDPKLFNRVQKSVKKRYLGGGARSEPIQRLLSSNVLRCGHCGSGMGCGNFSWSGPQRKREPCYFCVRRKSLGASICPLKPIKQEELESLVLDWFDEWFWSAPILCTTCYESQVPVV